MSSAVRFSLIVGLLIAESLGAGQFDHIFVVSPEKATQCHSPSIASCNSSLYPILNYQVAAWFFHPPFKSCRPLYTAGGVHNCTANNDLPATRELCEQLCGEPCTMSDGTQGICTLDEHCKEPVTQKSSAHPRPCGAYNVKCCARHTVLGSVKSSPLPQPVVNNAIDGRSLSSRLRFTKHHQQRTSAV